MKSRKNRSGSAIGSKSPNGGAETAAAAASASSSSEEDSEASSRDAGCASESAAGSECAYVGSWPLACWRGGRGCGAVQYDEAVGLYSREKVDSIRSCRDACSFRQSCASNSVERTMPSSLPRMSLAAASAAAESFRSRPASEARRCLIAARCATEMPWRTGPGSSLRFGRALGSPLSDMGRGRGGAARWGLNWRTPRVSRAAAPVSKLKKSMTQAKI